MKIRVVRIVFPILLILWMWMIYNMSSQTATESSAVSAGFSHRLFSLLFPSYRELSEAAQREILSDFSFIVRKTAHFSLYFIMGVLSFFSFYTYKSINIKLRSVISVGVCAAFAATDEWHQTFVEGRSGELRDVLIDSSGALLAVLVILLIVKLISKKSGDKRCVKKNF